MVAVERLAAAVESKREIRFVTDVCQSPLSATYYGMKALVPYLAVAQPYIMDPS